MRNIIWCLFVILISSYSMISAAQLEEAFENPPDLAKPWVYWIVMDGHFSKEGITADFEAMKAVGIGGILHMEVDLDMPRGKVPFFSEKWKECFTHAVLEAERLGLEFTTITGPGWTGSGGPWIKVEDSMQHLVPVSINVKGPQKINQVLPMPQPRVSSYHRRVTEQMRKDVADFYEDVFVYAFPRCDPAIENDNEKALFFRGPYTSKPGVRTHFPSPVSYPALATSKVLDPKKIIDLTDRLQADGRLQWEVPPGEWTILRMGRRSTGSNTRPAPATGVGFESNKFDRKALETHFKNYFDPLLKSIGQRPQNRTTGFTGLDADSWEMGAQNWTTGFRQEFIKRRGYDPWPYFPAYSGFAVESREVTERFLWDIRMTCQELLFDEHIKPMKQLCHDRGLKLSIEPYDMNPTVDIDLGSFADIPMGEFWTTHYKSAWSCFEAASIGHIMGKSIVAAEAFTSHSTFWRPTPWKLKNQADWAFAAGINRFVIVTFTHQPWLDRSPGITFKHYGLQWERTQTFWPLLTGYHQYLARCSHMMQQGVTVSDILYLTPEGAPHVFRAPESALHAANGFFPDKKGSGFDACTPRILMNRAEVKEGTIAFAGGSSYRLLVLPNYASMTPELLEKIGALVKAGATVVGSPPVKSPSLTHYPACDDKLQSLAKELWGDLKPGALNVRNHGKGRIYRTEVAQETLYPSYDTTRGLLEHMGVAEDFTTTGPIRYGHRQSEDHEIYFLANRSNKKQEANCSFRVKGQPQLWDPVTGTRRQLPTYQQAKGRTDILLQFEPFQSYFIVFPTKNSEKSLALTHSTNFPSTEPTLQLDGPWDVAFDPKWGGPKQLSFASLQDWSTRDEEGIKYYSGIATYRKTFDFPHEANGPVYLDLGTVHEMARVTLNGKELGVVWCAPWRIDISEALQKNNNHVEIEVANLWPNRLIGDAAKPANERFTWTMTLGNPYKADTKLLPSGLIGPVRIMTSSVRSRAD